MEEGRKRWRARLDHLKEECSAEQASLRDEVAALSARLEVVEEAERQASTAAQEAITTLKVSIDAEFSQVRVDAPLSSPYK